jgi:hypothetical protein
MPKLLTGCHYNEEEISRQFVKKKGYWPVQMNGNKFATGQILIKPVEVVREETDFSWLSSKDSRTLVKWPSVSHTVCVLIRRLLSEPFPKNNPCSSYVSLI